MLVAAGYLGYALFSEYSLDGVSRFAHCETIQEEKQFKEVGTIGNITVFTYGVEDVWYQTVSAKGISLEDYISKKRMTVEKWLKGKEKETLSDQITVYSDGDGMSIKYICYTDHIIVTSVDNDFNEVVKAFQIFLEFVPV